ncbi:MAG: lysine--tRNA ligase, partial [Elusimicrobia bacterium]|nr:lysine--tRNA ligase [Elusimicrobiota bacterium]
MSDSQTPPSEKTTPVEQIVAQRREKKDRLIAEGKTPYGHRFQRSMMLSEVHERFEARIPRTAEAASMIDPQELHLAGRLMTRRDLGKLCFAHIKDHYGQLQIKVSKQEVGDAPYKEFTKDVDLGDIVGLTGHMCRTKTGELTLQVKAFEILSKSIRPWPEKFHGMTDIELRSRQRELDLGTNEESKNRFLTRSRIIDSLRQTLRESRFVEVETPLMQAVPGGALAKPFITHHEALDVDLYMRIAPELFLKRLIVGGFDRVYEIGRAFRNEGIDTRHNPEFTILEAYQAYGDVNDMMDLAEKLIQGAARAIGVTEINYRGVVQRVDQPFDRSSFLDLYKRIDLDFVELCRSGAWLQAARAKNLTIPKGTTEGKAFDLIFDELILPTLERPTFVLDYPSAVSPLAKTKPGQPLIADRFELFLAKEEVANAYTEQNDPDIQRQKFADEIGKRQKGDEEAMPTDEEFVNALEHGMPPAGGLGIGIDRL